MFSSFSWLPEFLQRLIWVPIRAFLRYFVDFRISGLANLALLGKERGGIIFAANHAWVIDPILVPAGLPFFSRFFPMYFVSLSKDHYRHIPGWKYISGGLFFRAWGAYPVTLGLQDFEQALKYHIRFLEQGQNVCIFPEGGICREGVRRGAKPGIAYLASRTKAIIIPVHLISSGPLTVKGFFGRQLTVQIVYGKPITVSSVLQSSGTHTIDDYKAASEKILHAVYSLTQDHEA